MVNVNIEIPDELHKQLKLASVLQDTTLKDYVISALDKELPRLLPRESGEPGGG